MREIGSRECLERQLRLVRASEEDLGSLPEEIPLDPAFPLFACYCREENIPLVIASDSFDFLVTPFLQRHRLTGFPLIRTGCGYRKSGYFPRFLTQTLNVATPIANARC